MKSIKLIKLFNQLVSHSAQRHCNKVHLRCCHSISCGTQMSDQNKDQQKVEVGGGDHHNVNESKLTDQEVATSQRPTESGAGNSATNVTKREKLRKWVLLLSYCGQNYYGMQRQTNDEEHPTIEYRLFESLWKAGVINEEKFKEQQLSRFQRAARTDKGVSAIKQIVSIILPVDFKEMVHKVNQSLPPEIRLMDCVRVTKFFDAKNYCDARTYSYLMPSYALCPVEEHTTEAFRLSPKTLTEFNELLQLYVGTHNFHNFTSAKAATDASAMRYIKSMECSDPFLISGLEFVVVRVKGQAFMLHQIRKMIGLAIAAIRGITKPETIAKAFNPVRIDIPRAPGLGLLLEEVHYDKYNQRYGGDGTHEAIQWDHMNEEIDRFKHQHIYPLIVDTEKKEKPMFVWLQTLIFHTYSERPQRLNDESEEVTENSSETPLYFAHKRARIEINTKESDNNLEESCVDDQNKSDTDLKEVISNQ